jgi:hypothetical protein
MVKTNKNTKIIYGNMPIRDYIVGMVSLSVYFSVLILESVAAVTLLIIQWLCSFKASIPVMKI